MRKICIILALLLGWGGFDAFAVGQWVYPIFKEVGPVKRLPDAQFQPDKRIQYSVLFEVAEGTLREQNGTVNPELKKVARYINTLAVGGVSVRGMDIALIVHARALPIVLKDRVHREQFGTGNPNLELIDRLRKAGVELYVCGLNLADWEYDHEWVLEDFRIGLSYLVVVTTLQLKGYAYVPS